MEFGIIALSIINCLAALIASLILCPLFMRVAFWFNLVDKPDGLLKKHQQITPYLGGVAVFCATFLSIISVCLFFVPHHPIAITYGLSFVWFSIACCGLLILGLYDDSRPLSPLAKWIWQAVAASLFLYGGFFIRPFVLNNTMIPQSITMFISFWWFMTIVNAFNLIDVMDGLATAVALTQTSMLLMIALLSANIPVIIITSGLMGALFGFMKYNFPPARMYLGDAGSMFIGGILAAVPFMINWQAFGLYESYVFCIMAGIAVVPLLEVASLIIIRTHKKIPFYQGSRDHFCHYLMDKGWQKRTILLYAALFNIISTTVIFGTCFFGNIKLLLSVGSMLILLWYFAILF